MIVLDASAAIELLLMLPRGTRIAERTLDASPGVCAPHLLDAEVGQVLRRLVREKRLSPARARLAMTDLSDLPLERYPHVPLMSRAFALRGNVSFYDALYVALAEALDATLLTCDASLARAPSHRARIEVVG